MKNKLPDFYEQHSEYRGFVGLNILAWEEEYGDEFIADIAESEAEAKAQYQYYSEHGYVLRDENAFGNSKGGSYRISCYAKAEKNK